MKNPLALSKRILKALMRPFMSDRVSQNHERFASEGEIAVSADVRGLAAAADPVLKETA